MTETISIIVLCYNGLQEATIPCVESILRNTPHDRYELIIVDNASTDGTQNYLRQLAITQHQIKLCLNKTNRGFAGGNNDGIRLAKGAFLVLLNNDTLVPPGWSNALINLLIGRKDVGLVGPVTNSAGNEQRVDLSGLNERNFAAIAKGYTDRQQGVWFTTERLGFFCVAMRRTLVQSVGFLDEQFGIGMFEDDDFCLRVKKAGYKLAVVEDSFVYHKGSVSFCKLAAAEYRVLFERNKSYFFTKHGVNWTFSEIAFMYWEKFHGDFQAIKATCQIDPALERILTRWENFRHLLVQIHQAESQAKPNNYDLRPNSIAKKFQLAVYWNNFKRSMLCGSNFERLRYLRRVSRALVNKFSYHQKTLHCQLIDELATIHREANDQKKKF
jgi:GT2 family glycosyltransferase